jgi:hypothetical protein
MQFTKGTFQEFRATTKVHLGQAGIDIHQDDIIEFDGQTLNYGGNTHQVPTLRSAIKAGWFVSSTDTTSKYVPKSASISIRSANTDEKKQMSVKTVQNEERVVGRVPEKEDPSKVQVQDEGTPVKTTLKTSTKQKTVLTDKTNVDQEVSKLENTQVKSSKYQVVRQEDQRVETSRTPSPKASVQTSRDDGAIVAGKIKSPAKQKISLDGTNKSFDQVYAPKKAEIFKVAKATGDVDEQIEGEELTELLPEAAVAKTTMPSDEVQEEVQVEVQVEVQDETETPKAESFDWDVKANWRTRVKKATALYNSDRDLYNQVLLLETDAVKKRILDAISE